MRSIIDRQELLLPLHAPKRPLLLHPLTAANLEKQAMSDLEKPATTDA